MDKFVVKTDFLDGIDHINWLLDIGNKFLNKEYKYNVFNRNILFKNILLFLEKYETIYCYKLHNWINSTNFQSNKSELTNLFVSGEFTKDKIKNMMEDINYLLFHKSLRYNEQEFIAYYKANIQLTRLDHGINEIYVKKTFYSQLEYGLSQKWDYQIIEASIKHKYGQSGVVNRFITNDYLIYPYRLSDKSLTVQCHITNLNEREHIIDIQIQLPPRHIILYDSDIKGQVIELVKEQLHFTPILYLNKVNMIPISEMNTEIGIPITTVSYVYNIDTEKENPNNYTPLTVQITDENNQQYDIFL